MTAAPVFDAEAGVLRLAPRHWAALAGGHDGSAVAELEAAGAMADGQVAPALVPVVEGWVEAGHRLQVEVRTIDEIRTYVLRAGAAGVLVVEEGSDTDPTEVSASPALDDLPSALAVLLGLEPRPSPAGRPSEVPIPSSVRPEAAGAGWSAPIAGASPGVVMVVDAPGASGDRLVAADLGPAGWWLGTLRGGAAGQLSPASATEVWVAFSLLLSVLDAPPHPDV